MSPTALNQATNPQATNPQAANPQAINATAVALQALGLGQGNANRLLNAPIPNGTSLFRRP